MGLLDRFRKKERRRAVVVGLDGVPYTLLQDLIQRGRIPNMSKIFQKGYFGRMDVSIPEISSVSWSSFMTGTQAGEHGIYGFIDLEPGTYKMHFPNYSHLKASTLWERLADLNKKSVVINMPATYPAREIEGCLISGFVATDINKAVYPTSLLPKIKGMGYRIDLDLIKARQDHDFLFNDLDATLRGREKAVDFLWGEFDWDLFIVVITGTDRLMHFLWDAYEDKGHRHHQHFMEYFNKVDTFIARVYDRFMDLEGSKETKNHFFILSDHGFTKIKTEVYLNRWLQENGYLKFKNDNPETIMDIGKGSTAFALDPSRIYINLKGKYPLGTVNSSEYNHLCLELKERLEELSFDDGDKLVKKIYLKDEIYHGPHIENAPDIVILSNHGYDLKGRVNSNQVFCRTNLVGMHTQDDAFFFNSNGMECKTIFNASEIILRTLLK